MDAISQTTFSNAFVVCTENAWILIEISLKFVPKDPINNIPALVQLMAWRRPGDKPLSKPIMVWLLTHIYAPLGLNELTLGDRIILTMNFYHVIFASDICGIFIESETN